RMESAETAAIKAGSGRRHNAVRVDGCPECHTLRACAPADAALAAAVLAAKERHDQGDERCLGSRRHVGREQAENPATDREGRTDHGAVALQAIANRDDPIPELAPSGALHEHTVRFGKTAG